MYALTDDPRSTSERCGSSDASHGSEAQARTAQNAPSYKSSSNTKRSGEEDAVAGAVKSNRQSSNQIDFERKRSLASKDHIKHGLEGDDKQAQGDTTPAEVSHSRLSLSNDPIKRGWLFTDFLADWAMFANTMLDSRHKCRFCHTSCCPSSENDDSVRTS